jgi:pyruvate carboxylase
MSDIEALKRTKASGSTEEAIEDGVDTHTQNTVHERLRANSSVMKAKKILGMSYSVL